ncbi:MAG: response regulator [Saezia sp.]
MSIQSILIVDDSKTELAYLTSILKQGGYSIRTAENAEQAMQRLGENAPDLILMDVIMPGMNGFQLTRKIKRETVFSKIPIILCTSKDQPTDRFWGLKQGATEYLVKPVDADELLEKISALKHKV